MEQINLENLSPEVIKYINALKSENSSLQKENVDLKNKVQKQEQFISNLTEMLVNDRKKMFGRSSEQMKYIEGAEQISLFNEAEKESAAGQRSPMKRHLLQLTNAAGNVLKKNLPKDWNTSSRYAR